MRIAVTGSVATDYLMTFPGRFADSLMADKLEEVSLSFLVDDLDVRRGGIGPNICFGLAQLGLSPVLVGAVGADFDSDYRPWLEGHGVDCSGVRVSTSLHTARFHCMTDVDHNQIASFYAGAMSEAREIDLAAVAEAVGGLDLVIISPDDPAAMVRHTAVARDHGIRFVADPSQQLARMDDRAEIRSLVEGAAFLIVNEYERELLAAKTGWTDDEIRDHVGVRITTLGKKGCRIEDGETVVDVGVPAEEALVDPTGVGDGFRSGFLAGLSWGLTLEQAAQVGSLVATLVLETVGTQEYAIEPARFLDRLEAAYGPETRQAVSAVTTWSTQAV